MPEAGKGAAEYASQWEAIRSVAEKIGCTAETLRKWVRQSEIDVAPRDDFRERVSERIRSDGWVGGSGTTR